VGQFNVWYVVFTDIHTLQYAETYPDTALVLRNVQPTTPRNMTDFCTELDIICVGNNTQFPAAYGPYKGFPSCLDMINTTFSGILLHPPNTPIVTDDGPYLWCRWFHELLINVGYPTLPEAATSLLADIHCEHAGMLTCTTTGVPEPCQPPGVSCT